jgi:chemotaxis protein CheC
LQLTEHERDALTELANMGVGRAAASLSRMVDEPIHLSVPDVALLTREEAACEMEARDPARLIAVRQDFSGSFAGHALLLFPETNSLELVRAVVGPQPTLEEIADLEEEAMAEVGNVILNGYLATIARYRCRTCCGAAAETSSRCATASRPTVAIRLCCSCTLISRSVRAGYAATLRW